MRLYNETKLQSIADKTLIFAEIFVNELTRKLTNPQHLKRTNLHNQMKIALIGYGKMGKTIEQIARDRGHEIVSVIDVNNPQDFESEAFRSADVAIEFTAPQAAYGNCMKAFAAGTGVFMVEGLQLIVAVLLVILGVTIVITSGKELIKAKKQA